MEYNILTGWGSKHILIGVNKALNWLPFSESRSVLTKRDCLSRNVLTSFSRTVAQGELLVRYNSKFRENLGFFLIKNANFSRGFAPGPQWGAYSAPHTPSWTGYQFLRFAMKLLTFVFEHFNISQKLIP